MASKTLTKKEMIAKIQDMEEKAWIRYHALSVQCGRDSRTTQDAYQRLDIINDIMQSLGIERKKFKKSEH